MGKIGSSRGVYYIRAEATNILSYECERFDIQSMACPWLRVFLVLASDVSDQPRTETCDETSKRRKTEKKSKKLFPFPECPHFPAIRSYVDAESSGTAAFLRITNIHANFRLGLGESVINELKPNLADCFGDRTRQQSQVAISSSKQSRARQYRVPST